MKKLHIVLGLATFLLLAFQARRMAEPPFGFADVSQLATQLSQQAYQAPKSDLPEPLKKLNYDQNRDIRWRDEGTLWKQDNLPFQVKFFQRTGWQPDRVDVYEIADKKPSRLLYNPSQFDFGKNDLAPFPANNMGYAGFRVHYPLNKKEYLDEAIVFLGGCYFRAVAQNQQYGMSARAVAINAGVPGQQEEFPRFTRFWLQKPARSSDTLRILALLEGPSLTGAYEFLVTPGEETKVDVRFVLNVRKKITRLGLAPLTSMYWFGENYRLNVQDVRPEVHDSDGLLLRTSGQEWLWRPLSNARHQRENFFMAGEKTSFGLIQRDRYFASYEDLESHYESRPSSWVEPGRGMENGQVALIQLPTNKETDDNVVAYWWSGKPVEAGSIIEGTYTLFLYGTTGNRPSLGTSSQTRIHYPVGAEPVLFSIDFMGDKLSKIPPEMPPEVELSAAGEVLQNIHIVPNEYIKGWRVTFELPNIQRKNAVELRCRLRDKNEVLTETWTYTWEAKP